MRMTTRIIYLFLFLVLSAYAQTDSTRIFKKHALQFRTAGLLSLSSFKGSFISYKYHPQDDYAFRFGISLSGTKTSEDNKRESLSVDTSFYDLDIDNNRFNIEFVIEYLKYFNPKDELKMFFGIGPRVYLQIYDSKANNIQAKNYSYQKDYTNNGYEIGVTCSYGLEWFFRDNMSLHAEYGFNFSYINTKQGYTRVYPQENNPDRYEKNSDDRNGFEIDDSSALLGLSLYFN